MHVPADDARDPPSIYARRAAPDPGEAFDGDRIVDVAVVGGGLTGLSAALHLAEAGARVSVVEARSIGWGASGRAFGQLVPYLKHGHVETIAHYGAERGERIVDAIGNGPRFVFKLIERLGIDCDLVQTGLLFGAHSTAGQRTLARRAAYWQGRGVPVAMLDRTQSQAAIGGAPYYVGALLDPRGGHVNPLALSRGLAHAARRAGASIHTCTIANRLDRDGEHWRLDTEKGRILAKDVVLATNAYSGELCRGLRQSFIAVRGHGLVSRPLSDNARHAILPGRQPLTDTRRLFSGLRMLPDGHLHVSLDGPCLGPERGPFLRKANERVARLFPFLDAITWQETWSGWIAVTRDQFPRVHELAPGLYAGFGYSGRGIVAATMIGAEIAKRIGGAADKDLVFPATPLSPIRGHGLCAFPLRAVVTGYRLLDAWDEIRWHGGRTGGRRRSRC